MLRKINDLSFLLSSCFNSAKYYFGVPGRHLLPDILSIVAPAKKLTLYPVENKEIRK